jgi:hypothetical protein
MKRVLIGFFCGIFVFYLLVSFISSDLNPLHWVGYEFDRSCWYSLLFGMLGALCGYKNDTKNF